MGTGSPSPVTVGAKSAVTALAQHHQAVVGFLVGFFLVLLAYTTLSSQFGSQTAIGVLQSSSAVPTDQQTAWTAPPLRPSTPSDLAQGTKDGGNAEQAGEQASDASDRMEEELIRHEIDQGGIKNETIVESAATPRKPICDLSDPRYDICEISGDARVMGANRTVLYVPPAGELGADSQEWSIRDQSRKHLEYISKVTVKSLNASQPAPECTSRHAVPALVFAMNGLTSNPWHDFSDVLVPLFITTRALEGEVQFLVSDLQPWFVDKYRLILKNLSRYDIVDLNQDGGVRCHPHVTVGLRSHRDLGIDPARAPRNYAMLDFRLYIREIYRLPPAGVSIPYKEAPEQQQRKPRLMLINRGRTRKFVNFPEIVAAVRNAGFEVITVEPRRDLGVEEFSRVVDSCDVLMGAHGAGLTNFFFLRTNAVLLQVVPWGHMEYPSMAFYGGPAREMRLRDVEYSIEDVESTLYDKYGKDSPVVSDPDSIHKQGWQFGMRYYWTEQDIRLNVTRYAPTLQQVDKDQYEKVLKYIDIGKREGATLVTGGKPCGDKGYYIEPTIFTDVKDNMSIAQDEIFGPVMALMKFKTVEEVIQKANNTRYGLAAGIVTKNIDIANTVSRSIRAGAIWINCYFAFDPDAPFGGYKMSGFGKDMGMDGLEKYLQTKTVVTPLYNTPWM